MFTLSAVTAMPVLLLLLLLAFSSFLSCILAQPTATYNVSMSSGVGPRFDGVGGLSGGGCTSRMLVSYLEPYRSFILDYLFVPQYAASLQILKVEIGGDVQSTEGTEPSHMHTAVDESYHRGYEFWLMKEAKRRNPHITVSALSWGFPRWVDEGTGQPFTNSTVRYITSWLRAAKEVHGVDVDYVGIWNERGYTDDYVISLRRGIQAAGLNTKIVAHDSGWDVCPDIDSNPAVSAAVDVIGAHYPNTESDSSCAATSKTLWASEDGAQTWDQGGACWARILNQNYVRGGMTATIAWNLVNTFYDELPFGGDGLMHAVTPWDGHYDIGHPIWVSAHHTHFTQQGWHYLHRGQGVGLLDHGGSYVSLTDGKQLTIIIEVMVRNSSQCHWGTGPEYDVAAETATFQLDASFSHVTSLHLYVTNVSNAADPADDFSYRGELAVSDGRVSLLLSPELLYTLSTVRSVGGQYPPAPPAATAFPLPYSDSFDSCLIDSEAPYFFDQAGSWQVVSSGSALGRVMRQQVLQPPVTWCQENPTPYSVIGSHAWLTLDLSISVLIEEGGMAFAAANVAEGGCRNDDKGTQAVVFGISTDGYYALCNSTVFSQHCLSSGQLTVLHNRWYRLRLVSDSDEWRGYVDGQLVVSLHRDPAVYPSMQPGWAGIGSSWSYVQFDDILIQAVNKTAEAAAAREQGRHVRQE